MQQVRKKKKRKKKKERLPSNSGRKKKQNPTTGEASTPQKIEHTMGKVEGELNGEVSFGDLLSSWEGHLEERGLKKIREGPEGRRDYISRGSE